MSWIILIILLVLFLSSFIKIDLSETETSAVPEEIGKQISFIAMSVRFPNPFGWIVIKINSEKHRLYCFRVNHFTWQFLIFLVLLYFILV